ncbi:DUF2268 domain-containing putative Zn-dependent protease [Arthrobacter sp. zg-Y1171]|uniref:DUF2268 domain-containing putative Zn-dependent protease n=1 Tax=Arthrobacter sp. zg-Y1171 TaxID=2964610 RepID=UPI002107B0EC|nr:DUF2268 domain-containing putative Zn-dependent protease [Arthrobacter sp. zg-Y1171]MCQ1995792.1 DUF2268 domain-containing putative Zn-dependent protease [Arthrobacter sp. zg-Y1171]UWX83127.1 DUF2268 domain-containing putative Zn-dependent protease [Arthrobacter sp. zg-Y1171]
MTIIVLDSAAGMEAVLQAAEGERSGLLRSMLAPMEGMCRYFPGQVDLAAMHGLSFGFPLDRDSESCREGLARLTTADAWGRIENALANAVDLQVQAVPEVKVPEITVLMVLGDPADEYFMADAFARQLDGDQLGYTPMGLPHLHDDAVFEKVLSGLDIGGMNNFTAWVHGDEAARRFGAEPVGLPAGAGYAAGNRLVDRFLAATGLSAAEALHLPSREIIDTALNDS